MRRITTLAFVASLLVGCAGGSEPSTSGGIASTAQLAIVAPMPGARVAADKIPVVISLSGARILKEAVKTVTPDTGHLHVSLDGPTLDNLAGLEFDLATMNKGPLAKGQHLLQAEFVAADHTFFVPRVIVTTTFVVA